MFFPKDNKIHETPKGVDEQIETNAEILETHLKKVDWKYLFHVYAFLFTIFTGSIFILILVVQLALMIF